jgi:hypothetical protein
VAALLCTGALTSSPEPIITLMLIGFGVGIFGHLAGSKVLVGVGIAIVFTAGLLAPQY